MKLMRMRNLFCATAVMTACTFCTAGFTSYAMSPDQGRDGGALTAEGSVLQLSGTPDKTGEFTFSVAASNCNGTVVTTAPVILQVDE